MNDDRTGVKMHNDEVKTWRSRVPPGVPGAGWFIAAFFVFAVVVFTGWTEGWWEGNYNTATAAHHTTTGSGNRTQ